MVRSVQSTAKTGDPRLSPPGLAGCRDIIIVGVSASGAGWPDVAATRAPRWRTEKCCRGARVEERVFSPAPVVWLVRNIVVTLCRGRRSMRTMLPDHLLERRHKWKRPSH